MDDVLTGAHSWEKAYLTRIGAMALHGPHQVAKASMITMSCSLRAALNSALL